ncbi:MAG: adenylosuccinate lyase [Halococcoides sp.]
MADRDPLRAVSPLDGRYARYTEPLVEYVSEQALIRARVRVEIEYLIALADLDVTPVTIDDDQRDHLRAIHEDFDAGDAARVKQIETEGTDEYAATNHDVKAVEYFLRARLPEGLGAEWLHFGLTSEDVNNLAYRLLIGPAVREVLLDDLRAIRDRLVAFAHEYRNLSMLARTHGQPATPTTFGKEMAVYASRMGRAIGDVERAVDDLSGKLAGASGTYAAHHVAYPDITWPAFAADFVADLGLDHEPLTTQVNPSDDLARLFDALRRVNNMLIDLDRDAWLYVSQGYLGQDAGDDETGSSTMPHKVNPIDFENSEGNLSKATSDLAFLGSYLTNSRLQRDLSDSTVKRQIGGTLAHCRIGYVKTLAGLESVTPVAETMREDLEATPAVLAEAYQTVLRREGHPDAYEQIKAATRGREVTIEDLRGALDGIDIDPAVADRLRALTPAEYTGLAAEIARSV